MPIHRAKRNIFMLSNIVGNDDTLDFETKGVYYWLRCLLENEGEMQFENVLEKVKAKGSTKNFKILVEKGYIYKENGDVVII